MYRLFNDYCKANIISRQDIADWLGKSISYVIPRMTGKQLFTIDDLYIICDKAGIPYEQIPYYFPKGGRLDFSTQYQKKMEALQNVNPLTFADVLIKAGKAMKTIEQSELNQDVLSLFGKK